MRLETSDIIFSGFGSSSADASVTVRLNAAAFAAKVITSSFTSSYEHCDRSSFRSIGGDGRSSIGVKKASNPRAVKFLNPLNCNALRLPLVLHLRIHGNISSVSCGLELISIPSNVPPLIDPSTIATTSSSTFSISLSFKNFKFRRASEEAPKVKRASLLKGIFCNNNSSNTPCPP